VVATARQFKPPAFGAHAPPEFVDANTFGEPSCTAQSLVPSAEEAVQSQGYRAAMLFEVQLNPALVEVKSPADCTAATKLLPSADEARKTPFALVGVQATVFELQDAPEFVEV
jgi:hypothetical protein